MLFHRDRRHQNARSERVYAAFEIAYTVVDFIAALTFLLGSIMFLSEAWTTFGTWLFIVGSVCFTAKPTIRLVRELKLAAIGDTEDLAARLRG
ncbi:YrhK family protein [Sulfitobacter sp. LCG007]